MRFKINPDKNDGWEISFAFMPLKIGNEIIWLERYWSRFMGIYTEVKKY